MRDGLVGRFSLVFDGNLTGGFSDVRPVWSDGLVGRLSGLILGINLFGASSLLFGLFGNILLPRIAFSIRVAFGFVTNIAVVGIWFGTFGYGVIRLAAIAVEYYFRLRVVSRAITSLVAVVAGDAGKEC